MDDIQSNNTNSEETPTSNINPIEEKSFKDVWRDIQANSGRWFSQFGHFLHDITDIKEGLDEQGTKDSIHKNIQIKGSNVWLLMSAIMVASLGLNLNSPAVIIGAMLISPLMSPILGIGLSVGINDRATLYQSLYHFGVAIAVSLITSALYFKITPLSGSATSEILARTSPTILDVLVAFFGGIAGIVSGSRAEKSNAIPGVAIATALLPPLCVSGFGLANGEWNIFINSLYLFFLNSVFIALATYLIVRFLGFKMKQYQNPTEKNRSTWIVVVFVALMVLPSIFILRGVMEKVNLDRNVKAFVNELIEINNRHVDYECEPYMTENGDISDSLVLRVWVLYGDTIDTQTTQNLRAKLIDYDLKEVGLEVNQSRGDNIGRFLKQRNEEINKEKSIYQAVIQDKESKINYLYGYIDSLKSPQAVLNSIEILYPEIERKEFGLMSVITDTSRYEIPTLTIEWKPKTGARLKQNANKKLGEYLMQKLDLDTIQVK